ncbi:MAG: sigma-70 family RNA polymerase sigma factor [Polyangiaceae bacterium]
MDETLDRLGFLARKDRGRLAAIARAEGLNAEDAVDCVQEALCTFMDLAKREDLPKSSDEWGPLLSGIVRNAARNHRRLHANARPHLEIVDDERIDPKVVIADDLIARAEDHVRLRACVQELCAVQKAVVTLRLLEEIPGEDVANTLGISSGHVAVLLHRAKRSLHACMTA